MTRREPVASRETGSPVPGSEDSSGQLTGRRDDSLRHFFLSLAFFAVLGVSVWFGYVQIFTKGLERLPAKVCEGAVPRDLPIAALPPVRSAHQWSEHGGHGRNFSLDCAVYAGDSILSGRATLNNATVQNWLVHYQARGDKGVLRVSADSAGVEALAVLDDGGRTSAAVYIPCRPRYIPPGEPSGPYGIIVEGAVVGESRVTGAVLGQVLTDFSYQLAKRAYRLADCQGLPDFPEQLPRY
jgi:hypothetical protein